MSTHRLFYRGDFDNDKAAAPNGAIVNKAYLDFIAGGAWAKTKTIKVREGVHTIVGYSLSNYTFIEGESGLIAFDAGGNIGMAKDILAMIREISDKPIKAIIYSHHHYTGGARVYVDEGGAEKVEVYGHPDLDMYIQATTGLLGPMQYRRAGIQLGMYLPHEGPDAVFGPAEPLFDDPALNANGHVPVSYPVADGEEVIIDGIKTVFHHVVADTRDSLIVHFPDLDLILHNAAVIPNTFPLYTLRGDFYRTPTEMIAGIDKIRSINPTYMLGCHGTPLTSKEAVQDVATAHRDAYAFIYNQSVRAINNGMTPDEMVNNLRLPEHLDQHPWLYPGYIDNEYSFRGQYRGIVGWYAEDTADLHPPTPGELGSAIVEGFGGADKLIAKATEAFNAKKYNLTAKLLSYVISAEPEHQAARQLKADALRAMAQTTRSGIQTRNFLMTHALHLEGKLDWTKPPAISFLPDPTTASVLATPPGTYLEFLETQIDPEKSKDVDSIVQITFADLDRSWALHVRRGVAEVMEVVPNQVDATLSLPRLVWAQMVLNEITLEQAIASGQATVAGDADTLRAVFNVFDQ